MLLLNDIHIYVASKNSFILHVFDRTMKTLNKIAANLNIFQW